MKNYLIKSIKKVYTILWRGPKEKIKIRAFSIGMIIILMLSQITTMNLVNAEVIYPKVTELKYVNDYAKVMDNDSVQYILSVGKELEDKTGAEATVVVIDSLDGQTIEGYANGIFRKWGIGQKIKIMGY